MIYHQKYKKIRKFEQMDWDQLNAEIFTDPRIQLAESSHDVNTICDNIIDTVNDLMDRQQPMKRIQINNKIPEFASESTKVTMKNRDDAMLKMKITKNQDDIRNYRTLRNRVHTLLHQDKEKQIKDKFDQVEGDSRKQWKSVKEQVGWTKQLSPEMLVKDGKTVRQPKQMADMINFAQISRNISLHRDVPKTETDFKVNYTKLTHGKNLNFSLRTVSMHELQMNIKEMKPTPSSGMDGLSLKTIKRVIKPLLKSILNLVNTTINTGTYPSSLKIARIVPLRKGDKNPTNPLNYRAINILPSLGKIIDRIVNKQMTRHLYLNKLFLQQHHGSVKGRSTMTAIISMLDDWAEGLEKGENNLILVLDQSAAYDVICHVKLIQKLKKFRV